MATPIAHKGAVAGAKVLARTALEFFRDEDKVQAAKEYFEEQTAGTQYIPFITADDAPPIDLNKDIMDRFRPQLEDYYFDETEYDNFLEQLGITYPTVRGSDDDDAGSNEKP